MWLGEQITARGVGNGISLIIMAGIVARIPVMMIQVFEQARTGAINPFTVFMIVAGVAALICGVVFMERAQRRLLVQYPKRQQGNRVFGGESSHLPLKINVAGVIPPIFASSLLLLPMTVANFNTTNIPGWLQATVVLLGPGQPLYIVLYAAMIIFFCFFYTAIVFNPEETADNLKKYGGFIPGIRPGKRTAEYIDYVLTRVTVVGAGYLALVCLIPEVISGMYGVTQFAFGGTSVLIVVSVTMDTVAQIQSHLIAQQYEGLIKKARLKGARPTR
jgi:preprotein translocase subunit SecY